MQESTMCYSKNDKPSKYEQVSYTYKWSLNNNCPDSDKKRSTACKELNRVSSNTNKD